MLIILSLFEAPPPIFHHAFWFVFVVLQLYIYPVVLVGIFRRAVGVLMVGSLAALCMKARDANNVVRSATICVGQLEHGQRETAIIRSASPYFSPCFLVCFFTAAVFFVDIFRRAVGVLMVGSLAALRKRTRGKSYDRTRSTKPPSFWPAGSPWTTSTNVLNFGPK